MKQKLLTLFALLLGVCSGAWAAVNTSLIDGITLPSLPTGTYTGGTSVTHNNSNKAVVLDANGNGIMQTSSPGYGNPTGDFSWANAAEGTTDGSWSTSGTTWDASGIFVGSAAYTTSDNPHYVNFARRCNLRTTRTFAYRFTNCAGISAYVKSQGNTDGAAACMAVYEIGAGSALTHVQTKSSKAKAADIITVNELSTTKTYVAYIYGMNSSNGELYEIAFLAPPPGPTITTTGTKSVTATESGVAATTNIAITGSNLTANGTLTAGFTSSVEGLSVSFGANTTSIDAEGAISTTVTVSYESTVNVPSGIAYLRISDGTTTENIAITYSASVVAWELQSVSKATTWDWNKITLTISDGHALFGDQAMKLSNSTTPSITDEIVYANYDGLYYTVGSGFDATTVAFTGQYPTRRNEFCQAGTVRIKAAVPGKIVVKFSDTGSSASENAVKRYLVVNGENTEYWTSREKIGDGAYAAQMNVVSGEINVPAGDVTITGSSAIVIYYITFTPTAEAISTKTDRNYASYVTTQKLDFASADGIQAFIATGLNGGKDAVLLEEVDIVPASTPIIVKTETQGATVNVPVTTAEPSDVSANKLVAGDGTTDATGSTYYYLASDQFHLATSGTLQSGKAYLICPAAARDLTITFGDATSIGATLKNKEIENKEVYNLKGQRVAAPTKGLYIQSGKKVIIK